MKNLILALSQANIPPNGIETILTEFEVWVDSKVLRSKEKLMIETIAPLQKDTDGIRSEVRFLAETMKHGFARMEERFQSMDQKLDFTRKSLELQISATRENLELQIKSNQESLEKQIKSNQESLEKQINSNRESLEMKINSNRESLELQISKLERQISATRENLETQIKANEKNMEKQFSFQQKLLWAVLSVVLGLFAKAIHLI